MNLQAINERPIKRFDPIMSHHDTAVMEECSDGSYITWEDHQAAVAQLQLAIQQAEKALQMIATADDAGVCDNGYSAGYVAKEAIRSLSSKQQDKTDKGESRG